MLALGRLDGVSPGLTLNRPDFRFKPFRAMMGALRVKSEVVVEVSAPLPPGKENGKASS